MRTFQFESESNAVRLPALFHASIRYMATGVLSLKQQIQ